MPPTEEAKPTRSRMLTMRLSPDEHACFERVAASFGGSIAAAVRRLMAERDPGVKSAKKTATKKTTSPKKSKKS